MNMKQLSEQYEGEFLEKVTRILEIPSVYEESEEYPYGKPIDDALNTMLEIADADGFSTKNIDGQAGHIEFGYGDELLGILGHLDVVPAGKGWTTQPFEPVVNDGKLYARGAQDDKGPVMAAYIAMKILKDQGFKPQKRIRLILGTDEERDWKGMEHYFNKEEMPALGFSPDASFPVIHAEKGLLDFYMNYKVTNKADTSSNIELIKINSGDRLNMVPDEASAVLRSNKDLKDQFLQFIHDHQLEGEFEEGHNECTVVVKGKSVHASTPESGINAISALVSYLLTLPLNDGDIELLSMIQRSFKESDGSGLQLNQSDSESGELTLNLGSLTWEESKCRLGINLRYPVTADSDSILSTLEKFTQEHGGHFELYDHLKALYMEKDHPFVQALLRVYNDATGEDLSALSIGGATYARSLNAGVAFGAMFSSSPDTAHQKDEHVRIADMIKAIEIYAASIYELTK
ncbi:dipeptidase PepV [Halobacillus sp. BBL2006]|uniref:dipeptidase PepV n=1 Tax=Halobacillus sp. BBL2006 TaxID=1543706 RepID=UPI000541C16A|nr:dipeptidase PepV [Halobacillus sp. BBL2006]KHE70564.1 Xaa-His dipeptidase [Halobacillus sp. BBL2006]